MWINDIIYEDNNFRFLLLSELERKYDMKIPFTEYAGIIQAIPRSWKEVLKNRKDEEWDYLEDYKLIDALDDNPHPYKKLYNTFKREKFEPPTRVTARWNLNLGTEHELVGYLTELEKSRTCTINNKLRSFNYNFFMRNIPYEQRLHKMKIKSSDKCVRCPNEEESILHLYWTCPMTYRLWERLKEILLSHTNIDLDLNPGSCLLGLDRTRYANRDKNTLISILCLLTKHYIHTCKCNDTAPCIRGLQWKILNTYRIEKNLAHYSNTLNMVNTKWGELANWLEEKITEEGV